MNYLHDFVEKDDNGFATLDRFNFDSHDSSDCDQAYDNAITVHTAFCKDQLFKPKQDEYCEYCEYMRFTSFIRLRITD